MDNENKKYTCADIADCIGITRSGFCRWLQKNLKEINTNGEKHAVKMGKDWLFDQTAYEYIINQRKKTSQPKAETIIQTAEENSIRTTANKLETFCENNKIPYIWRMIGTKLSQSQYNIAQKIQFYITKFNLSPSALNEIFTYKKAASIEQQSQNALKLLCLNEIQITTILGRKYLVPKHDNLTKNYETKNFNHDIETTIEHGINYAKFINQTINIQCKMAYDEIQKYTRFNPETYKKLLDKTEVEYNINEIIEIFTIFGIQLHISPETKLFYKDKIMDEIKAYKEIMNEIKTKEVKIQETNQTDKGEADKKMSSLIEASENISVTNKYKQELEELILYLEENKKEQGKIGSIFTSIIAKYYNIDIDDEFIVNNKKLKLERNGNETSFVSTEIQKENISPTILNLLLGYTKHEEIKLCPFKPKPGQTYWTVNIMTGEPLQCVYGKNKWTDNFASKFEFFFRTKEEAECAEPPNFM